MSCPNRQVVYTNCPNSQQIVTTNGPNRIVTTTTYPGQQVVTTRTVHPSGNGYSSSSYSTSSYSTGNGGQVQRVEKHATYSSGGGTGDLLGTGGPAFGQIQVTHGSTGNSSSGFSTGRASYSSSSVSYSSSSSKSYSSGH